jgi:hypothetical protein
MRYSIIPVRAIEDPHIHGAALRVLVSLGAYTDRDGYCYPSQSTLARRLRVSRQAVNQQIKILVKLGYLQVTHRKNASGGETSCLYRIYFEDSTTLEREGTPSSHIEVGIAPDGSCPPRKAEGDGVKNVTVKPGIQTQIQADTGTQNEWTQESHTIPTQGATLIGAPAETSGVASGETVAIAPRAMPDVAQTTQLTTHIPNKKNGEITRIRNTPGKTLIPPSSSHNSSHTRDPAFHTQGERVQSTLCSLLDSSILGESTWWKANFLSGKDSIPKTPLESQPPLELKVNRLVNPFLSSLEKPTHR